MVILCKPKYAKYRCESICVWHIAFIDRLVQADVLPVETGLPRRICQVPTSDSYIS